MSQPLVIDASYNAGIIEEFRARDGEVGGPWEGIPLLLLHHTGRLSGVGRVTPLAYLPAERGGYLVWAANGGAATRPAWYHNLQAHPGVRIEVGSDTIDVHADETLGPARDHLFAQATAHYPQLAEAARRAGRTIPMVVLAPARGGRD